MRVPAKSLPSPEGLYTPLKRGKTKKASRFQGEPRFTVNFQDSLGEVHSLLLALEETTREPESLLYSACSSPPPSGYVTQRTHDHRLKQRLGSESQHGTNPSPLLGLSF